MTDLYTAGLGALGSIYIDESTLDNLPKNPDGITNVIKYTGPDSTPRNVRRQRMSNLNALRRFGTPAVIKRRYTDRDVRLGIAEPSKVFDDMYGQTSYNDGTYGVGFVSIERSDNEWIDQEGTIVQSEVSPGPGYEPAPKYRGYGPAFLTYVILPDVPEDTFTMSSTGFIYRVQKAQAQMGWFPEVHDSDLLVIVELDRYERIIDTRERFLLNVNTPVSMRGLDRRGRLEYGENFGNRHVTDQFFTMSVIPETDALMDLPIVN